MTAIETLTEANRNKISEGLMLFIETELNTALESCPNPYLESLLYNLDNIINIARKRGYLDKEYGEKYFEKRNRIMHRISLSEE